VKPWIIALILFFIVLIAGIICYTQFEIVDSTRWAQPSREARSNPYLALDRWLSAEGYRIRVLDGGDLDTLTGAPEKMAYVEDSCFSWSGEDETALMLNGWIRNGGSLLVSLNNSDTNWRLAEYLESLGIERTGVNYDDSEEEVEAAEEEDEEEETPYFDWSTSFKITKKAGGVDRIGVMTGYGDAVKLVTLYMGQGKLILTGTSYFLQTDSLHSGVNADLAASLFAPPETADGTPGEQQSGKHGEQGILFIRGYREERHIFGTLMERGDFRPLAAAVFVLIFLGFWMVIPSFGRPLPIPERPGKPLRERFLAEGQFLKKYGALHKYREVYKRELEQRCRVRGIEMPALSAEPKNAGSKMNFKTFLEYQQKVMDKLEEKDMKEKS
jgi:hypothetical protein